MRKLIARFLLRNFGKRYGYDTGYMEMMLQESPIAFFKFARVRGAVAHREVVPIEARYAVAITGLLVENCGACTQLLINMALEAGMAKGQIEALLRRDIGAMNPSVALSFQFADAVLRYSGDDESYRAAIRDRWGPKGVIDLAMAMQMNRIYPMMKRALGYANECRHLDVAGRQIDAGQSA
jgi:hypothetical protein